LRVAQVAAERTSLEQELVKVWSWFGLAARDDGNCQDPMDQDLELPGRVVLKAQWILASPDGAELVRPQSKGGLDHGAFHQVPERFLQIRGQSFRGRNPVSQGA
jgi:hypothetical protein